jgi:MFS family permease
VDLWLRRRTWYVLFCTVSGALLFAAQYALPSHIDAFIVLVFAAQVAICLANAGIGGLMATSVPDEQRGRASGFANFGNIGMGAITAGLTLQLIESPTVKLPSFGESSSFRTVGFVVAVLVALPSLIVLAIDEPAPAKKSGSEIFRTMIHEVWSTVKQRSGWSGILLCISPVGTAAAMQIFTTFDKSYDASPRMTTIVNGYAGGFLTGAA